ncbi:amidohydrolase [Pseudomonas chlororaphis]|uniref:Amidohydrolase n=1 Tax=Pseudomonas chlororaphis TaxID=587753 RepID=A0A1Q8EML4_9PSED|nr:amidohydrolase family protein [Pseudomonas chlororaphis]OLF53028.1 amidohydrolase [Pseudomonas chlororaphis]
MGSNGSDHNCTQCGCHNPVWNTLKDTLDPIGQAPGAREQATDANGLSLVFTGGTIYPLRDGNMSERVEALGIHAGDVVATGTLALVEARMRALGIAYKVRSLEGKTLLPGLIEPHVHIVQSCAIEDWRDLGPFGDDQRLRKEPYDWRWLKQHIQDHLPKDSSSWFLGRGVDPALMPFEVVKDGLNRLIDFRCDPDFDPAAANVGNLDSVTRQQPILLISASMHTVYLNSAACRAVYEAPKNAKLREQYPSYSQYFEATRGVMQEEAGITAAINAIPAQQALQLLNIFTHLKAYFRQASSRGVTLLYDAMMDSQSKWVLAAYFLAHPRHLRIGYAAACNGTLESLGKLPRYRAPTREEARTFYQGGVKLVSDGSNQGLTGYQAQPYCCETDRPYGNFNFCEDPQHDTPSHTPARYKAVVRLAMNTGWPLMIHANGDRAIEFTLQAYEDALQGDSALEKRHRIEHCSLLSENDLRHMSRLGISPSFLIGHVGYWGYSFENAIFEDKAIHMLDLCKSALDHNLRISLHSDCTVTPLGPLRSMEQAVTRKLEGKRDEEGRFIDKAALQPTLNEGECLTRQQALKAITYDAAWQCHAEGWAGSLKDGHFADFVILGQDPLDERVPASSIRDIAVCETWKGGQKVYPD